jgi:hypothetical protein
MQHHPNADFDFYVGVLRAWSGRCDPYVLVVDGGSGPEAMMVGRCEVVSIDCRLGYKSLVKVKARQLTFIYGGLMGEASRENCSILLGFIEAALGRGAADLAEFHFIRTSSELYDLVSIHESILRRTHVLCLQMHRSTYLPTSPDEMLRKLSPKVRKNLRWQEKKLVQQFEGKVEIRHFHDHDDVARMFADIESIASKTYHRQLGVGFDGSDELRQRLDREASRGALQAYVLYLNGAPAAFWIATKYKDTLYSDFMGYDADHAKWSPGMYLVVKTMEGLCRDASASAVRYLDWGLGDAQYKEVLGDSSWMEANIRVFAPTPKGMMLQLLITPIAMADAQLKRVLARSGILQSVKTRWRRHLRRQEEN